MELGFIGLGRMGGNMVTRLLAKSTIRVVVHDRAEPSMAALVALGARAAGSPAQLVSLLSGTPRVVGQMRPNLPTMVEGGIPGFVTETWYGLLVPAGTPREVIALLNEVAVKAVQKPDVRDRLAQMGADPIAEPPEFFARYLAAEIARWAKVVRESKAKAE